MGADVIRVDRAESTSDPHYPACRYDLHNRGKSSLAVDLKMPAGSQVVLRLVARSDILIEGYRPGVAERLGIGPAQALAENPSLVYGRMTGWGQDGPLAATAGHDINYIAVTGALGAIGTDDPVPPLNLVGDYGGGGMLLTVGVLAALLVARSTGVGQVVDAAMVDGSALLTTATHGYLAEGTWLDQRNSNFLDGAAPYYSIYRTADDRHIAVGALEPQFFDALLHGLGLDGVEVGVQSDRSTWPRMREAFADRILSRTRDEWVDVFEGTDACVAPVLSLGEAPEHDHNSARGVFTEVDGVVQPAPAPRFSVTPAPNTRAPSRPGRDTDRVLRWLGYSDREIVKLRKEAIVA